MFDDEDFDDEELERERKEEKERVKNLPIVKKAEDLMNTVLAFLESVDDNEDDVELKPYLFEDISVINAKIHGAEAGDLFSIRMENAVIIKVHALNIRNIMHTYEMMGIGNPDYLELIRNEIEEFRKVFVDWVATFQRNDDFPDEWGLFN
ncbi:hypothetical protein SAMN06298216_2156 [Spirosomataceae bacterium TFI 002]|nr:hypothetical protein SAMN06298216_2156 [Spirosomataceae bacterium TFI 002]